MSCSYMKCPARYLKSKRFFDRRQKTVDLRDWITSFLKLFVKDQYCVSQPESNAVGSGIVSILNWFSLRFAFFVTVHYRCSRSFSRCFQKRGIKHFPRSNHNVFNSTFHKSMFLWDCNNLNYFGFRNVHCRRLLLYNAPKFLDQSLYTRTALYRNYTEASNKRSSFKWFCELRKVTDNV